MNGNPTPEQIRKHLEDFVCPWCLKGPYKSVASHTVKAHEISGYDLREWAELPRTHVLTDPDFHQETSQKRSERLANNPDERERFVRAGNSEEVIAQRASSWDREVSKRNHIAAKTTPEARARFRENLSDVDWSKVAQSRSADAVARQTERIQKARDRWQKTVGEERVSEMARKSAAKVSPESRAKSLKLAQRRVQELHRDPEWKAKWLASVSDSNRLVAKVPRSDYGDIKRRVALGETHQSIADDYGCSRGLISRILRNERGTSLPPSR